MKIPNKIKIGGHEVKVIQSSNLMRDRGHHGESQCNDLWIELESTTPESQQMSTFLHEIIEHINYLYELGLAHNQVTTLEATLFQILHDNKLVF